MYRVYDGAGVATTVAFDFKGHASSEQRQLVSDKTTQPDWSALLGESTIAAMATAAASLLDSETFEASSERDALGRVLKAISPDGSELRYRYDEGGGLQKVELEHRGSSTAQTVVGDITYNARGQREQVIYGSTSSPTMITIYGYHMPKIRTQKWSDIETETPLSEDAIRARYHPSADYRFSRSTYPAGVRFAGTSRQGSFYILSGACALVSSEGRFHLSAGDILDYPGGDFELEVKGEQELQILRVWLVPVF